MKQARDIARGCVATGEILPLRSTRTVIHIWRYGRRGPADRKCPDVAYG
jgi:hypothetical protein